MRRRLISAILSIAMIMSLFTVVFANPVGAAAETTNTYEKDREALKQAIRELYSKGPAINKAIPTSHFVPYGIITDADWNTTDTTAPDRHYVIVRARENLDAALGADSLTKYFVKDTKSFLEYFGTSDKVILADKVVWYASAQAPNTAEQQIIANIEAVIKYASAVYYFAQDENNETVDPSFNAGKNALVVETTKLVNDVLAALKAQIGKDADKPSAYAEDFMGYDYKGFLNASYKYHPALGINPYYNIAAEYDSTVVNPWAAYYDTSIYNTVFPMRATYFYTFDEIRANPEWSKLLLAFEFELRKLHTTTGEGILYVDYKNINKADFNGKFDALCKAILGSALLTGQKYDMTKEIKAYLKLKSVLDIYSKYIKDLYNNIYTSPNSELLANALMASRFVEFVDDVDYKLIALKYADIEGLANKILAGIEATKPVDYQVLGQTDINAGIKAVKDAKALVAGWPETEDNKGVRDALITAAADLEKMLPVTSSGKVTINVAAKTTSMLDLYDVEVWNDKFSVTFTPNYFAYIKYKAILDAAIANFTNKIFGLTLVTENTSSKAKLLETLNKYGYLVGVVGGVIDADGNSAVVTPLTKEYTWLLFDISTSGKAALDALATTADVEDLFAVLLAGSGSDAGLGTIGKVTSIYEKVVGYVYANGQNYDAAIENVYYFASEFNRAMGYYFNQTGFASDIDGIFTDWETGTVTVKNGYDVAADAVLSALAFLTKDLTVYMHTVKYNLDKIANFFNLTNLNDETALYDILPAYKDLAYHAGGSVADGKTHMLEANYPKDYLNKFVTAANNLKKILLTTVIDPAVDPANPTYNRATTAKLIDAEKAFIAATKALLTELGDARLDAYLADVQKASKVAYGIAGWNYEKLDTQLQTSGLVVSNYILTTTPRNYEYFAFTLKSVANWNDPVNYYAYDANASISRFDLNFYNALVSALGINTDASGYARDAAEKASKLLQSGTALKAAIGITDPRPATLNIATDMPLWYAQKLLADIQGIPAMLSQNSIAAIAAKKAAVGGLNELVAKAEALNVYDYIVKENAEYDKIWNAFMAAYNAAVKAQYDKTIPLADIDAVVKDLAEKMAALDSIKRPEDAEVVSVEDFEAAIAKAEATLARYDLAEDLEAVNTLKEVINAANKLLVYNISVLTAGELKDEIKKLEDAVADVLEVIYVGDALKADVEAEAAGVDAALYTDESYYNFKAAVDDALLLAASETAKVSECKAALEKVKSTKAALALKPEEPVVVESDTRKEAIATYEKAVADFAALGDGYSAESVANLKTAIDALKAGIDANVTDAQLIDLIVKLRLANAALIVAPAHTFDD